MPCRLRGRTTRWPWTTARAAFTSTAGPDSLIPGSKTVYMSAFVFRLRLINGTDYLNDLWMYSIATGWWTWVRGSANPNQRGTYGTQGTAAVDNIISGRYGHSMVIDDDSRVAYILGGYGYGAVGVPGMIHRTDW